MIRRSRESFSLFEERVTCSERSSGVFEPRASCPCRTGETPVIPNAYALDHLRPVRDRRPCGDGMDQLHRAAPRSAGAGGGERAAGAVADGFITVAADRAGNRSA